MPEIRKRLLESDDSHRLLFSRHCVERAESLVPTGQTADIVMIGEVSVRSHAWPIGMHAGGCLALGDFGIVVFGNVLVHPFERVVGWDVVYGVDLSSPPFTGVGFDFSTAEGERIKFRETYCGKTSDERSRCIVKLCSKYLSMDV